MGRKVKRLANREAVRISTQSADEIPLRSQVDGPITELSFLRRAMLMAECSMIAYLHVDECSRAARRLGFDEVHFFDRDGSQAYWFTNSNDSVVACRGTEAHEWNDIRADANALTDLAETVGRVHRGFKREVDDLWPMIEQALVRNSKTLWFTGHSLGGAMATICAGRCKLSHIDSNPRELHTFGSPRVGNKRYVNYTRLAYYRWVNNNDIVTRVPPAWLGYRHTGEEKYFNRHGDIRDIRGWRRFNDRLRGFLRGILNWRIDQLSDHSTLEYIEYLENAIEREEKTASAH